MTAADVRRLVSEGVIERVEPDSGTARDEIAAARQHIESVGRIVENDPVGAFAMAYDAMRKAISAQMRASGYRVTKGKGGHLRTGRYALAALDHLDIAEHIDAFDALRQLRNQSEYDALLVDETDVEEALGHARVLVAVVQTEIGP